VGRWLYTEIKCRLQNLDTVTHPSTNRAQRMLTLLIETNALTLHQTATANQQLLHYNIIVKTKRCPSVNVDAIATLKACCDLDL